MSARRLKRSVDKRNQASLPERHKSMRMMLSAIVRRDGEQRFARDELETSDPERVEVVIDNDLVIVRQK